MARIMLGPAGSPAASTLEGISKVKVLGLQAMEVQFSHGIAKRNGLAMRVGEEARKHGISLSIHAPYYINLASAEKEKIGASRQRILTSCERGHHMGATKVVFHAAYYGKLSSEKTYEMVRKAIERMKSVLDKKRWTPELCLETTGKTSQWGTLEEVLRMSKETGCSFCVDFAHLYARNRGHINYAVLLDHIQKAGHKKMHAHFSNINFGLKGERNHLVLDGKPPFEPLARELMERKLDATIICESPITWKDSLKMKAIFEKLGHRF